MSVSIKIVSCQHPEFWYADIVGEVLCSVGICKEGWVSTCKEGYINIVLFKDAEVVTDD